MALSTINRNLDMNAIAQAKNGEQAISLFRQHQPDVTLMDLRMPEVEGVTAISAICATAKSARIIVLTTYDSDEDIYRGLQAGAKGYLLKEIKPDELLSERELAVLRSLAQEIRNADIAAALSIGEGTVKSHVNRILNKLDVSDRTQAVIVAFKRGIINL